MFKPYIDELVAAPLGCCTTFQQSRPVTDIALAGGEAVMQLE